jgi:hypothetical protein
MLALCVESNDAEGQDASSNGCACASVCAAYRDAPDHRTERLDRMRSMELLVPVSARPKSGVTVPSLLLLVFAAHTPALLAQAPQHLAWEILRAGMNEKSTGKRVQAVRALRLLPGDPEAAEMAQRALQDRKHQVRVAAATALGLMGSKASIPELKNALTDKDASVVLAAAHALQVLNDPAGYEVYRELLTGERKSVNGLVAQEMETMKDPKKMAELGVEEGVGFAPFGDLGFSAAKAIAKDDTSPVRAAAARILVNDPDPRTSQVLVRAVSDKSWIVRASALLAIAKREDPGILNAIVPSLSDKNGVVRCTAAAAVIRLTAIEERNQNQDVKVTKMASEKRE